MISWAHTDSTWSPDRRTRWRDDIRLFAETLVANGIDPELDLWHLAETEIDWTRWGPRQVETCDFTAIVINNAWAQRWQGTNSAHEGAGVAAEADAIKGIF